MKTIIILGMHRSATSMIAKGLHGIGVFMGSDLLPPSKHNQWGHFEDREFVHLNDRILHSAGGKWDNPPLESNILAQADNYGPDIERLIKTRMDSVSDEYPVWGWKDPRTTLTIELYMPYVVNPHFIACYREPQEVAKSLFNRDGIGKQCGEMLAKEYNRRMLTFLSKFSTL